MFKVILIGWGRFIWRSYYMGLLGVDCGFEMFYVVLIKIINKKYIIYLVWYRMIVFIVVLGGFFIFLVFFDNIVIEWN